MFQQQQGGQCKRVKGPPEDLEHKSAMLCQTVAAMPRINHREAKVDLVRPARKLFD